MTTAHTLNIVADIFASTNLVSPYQLYVGLSTTTPSTGGSNITEPSSSAGYARVLINDFSKPVGGIANNLSEVVFPVCKENWGNVTHFAIYAHKSGGGRPLMYGPLSEAQTIKAGDTVKIESGALRLLVEHPSCAFNTELGEQPYDAVLEQHVVSGDIELSPVRNFEITNMAGKR